MWITYSTTSYLYKKTFTTMKIRMSLIVLLAAALFACQQQGAENKSAENATAEYASFGEVISADDALPVAELVSMSADSAYTKVTGKVVDVCQAKGCWMKLDLGNNQTVRVTFKDYGFFVPKDSKGKEVVIEGVALRSITPVDELRHYAEDAGKSADEIAAITDPVEELSFEAVGVLMK